MRNDGKYTDGGDWVEKDSITCRCGWKAAGGGAKFWGMYVMNGVNGGYVISLADPAAKGFRYE
jgi:hypothetical protein